MTIPSITSGFFTSVGQTSFTTKGTSTFLVPQGVFEIGVVCIGGGGSGSKGANGAEQPGGGGGGLRWISGLPVTPGETLTVFVGYGGTSVPSATTSVGVAGTWSYISRGANVLVRADGGNGANLWTSGTATGGTGGQGTSIGPGPFGGTVGGGDGGAGGNTIGTNDSGGGGAGGYSGTGGNGAGSQNATAQAGSGGGGAGGEDSGSQGYGGGGVGLLGGGANGTTTATVGNGGSGGSSGSTGNGGAYGGGGGGFDSNSNLAAGNGADGAVRIIWGLGRNYPSTNTGDIS